MNRATQTDFTPCNDDDPSRDLPDGDDVSSNPNLANSATLKSNRTKVTPSSYKYSPPTALIAGGIIAGTVVVGVGVGIAAFALLPTAIRALGFEAGGIQAGSTATHLMRMGKGSTPYLVSKMQSVGATGAIAKGTATAVGAVAAAGTFAGSSVATVGNRKKMKKMVDKATQTDQ